MASLTLLDRVRRIALALPDTEGAGEAEGGEGAKAARRPEAKARGRSRR